MKLKITILGCGNSAGVPAIGNHWGKCDPAEPKNRRTRASIAVRSDDKTLIVDTGPDFKEQLNREDIRHIDAVLYTHAHSDHILGIDDLRVLRLRNKKVIPIYGDSPTLKEIREKFSYLFLDHGPDGLYPRTVNPRLIRAKDMGRKITVSGIPLTPFIQSHGTAGRSLGFRFGDLAYSTDMKDLDRKALKALAGIKTWVIDCNGYKNTDNHVHGTMKTVLALNEIVRAPQVYLTHMPGFMDYKTVRDDLPRGYAPAYDGLVLNAVV